MSTINTQRGTPGPDRLNNTKGKTTQIGLEGNDNLTSKANGVQQLGNQGDDFITSTGDNNVQRGGRGNDFLGVIGANNAQFGDLGDDTLRTQGHGNFASGGDGKDRFVLNTAHSRINGDAGNDFFTGGVTGSRVDGGTGSDGAILTARDSRISNIENVALQQGSTGNTVTVDPRAHETIAQLQGTTNSTVSNFDSTQLNQSHGNTVESDRNGGAILHESFGNTVRNAADVALGGGSAGNTIEARENQVTALHGNVQGNTIDLPGGGKREQLFFSDGLREQGPQVANQQGIRDLLNRPETEVIIQDGTINIFNRNRAGGETQENRDLLLTFRGANPQELEAFVTGINPHVNINREFSDRLPPTEKPRD